MHHTSVYCMMCGVVYSYMISIYYKQKENDAILCWIQQFGQQQSIIVLEFFDMVSCILWQGIIVSYGSCFMAGYCCELQLCIVSKSANFIQMYSSTV